MTTATEIIKPKKRRLGAFLFAATAALVAAPAALAAVWSINEVNSDFTLTTCLAKSEGQDGIDFGTADTDNFYINFDATTTNTDAVTGATVLQETLVVNAPAGFKTYSTDTFRLDTDGCGYDFNVELTAAATNSFGEANVIAWGDLGVEIYLSEVAAPGDDFTNAADWDQTPLVVNNLGVVTNATTGQAVLADDSNLVVGFALAGGATAETGEFNFQVKFIPVP